MERRLALLLAVLALVVAGLLPLAAMLCKSIVVDGTLTLAVYEKLFAHPGRYAASIGHSFALAGLTAAGATALGVPLGLLLGKTDLPLRRALAVLVSIPLLLPPYILAVCWFNLLARGGPLARVIPARALETLAGWLFGLPGSLVVLVSAFMPVAMILTLAYLRTVNPRLEEAGRLIARWPAVLRGVSLPMILPGILFAAMLVFLLALGELGVPMFLRYPVFPVETLTQFSAFYDFGAAAAAATPLLAVTLLVLAVERMLLRDRTYRLLSTPLARRTLLIPLGRWRAPAFAVVSLLAMVTVVLPLLALVATSLAPGAYSHAWTQGAHSLGRSLLLSALGATALAALGYACGYLSHHRALRLWRAVDTLVLLLFTLPGTVVGVGLIALWNRPATAFLYSSAAMVLLAYVAQYTALTSRVMQATLANLPRSLEESAQMAGAPWLARTLRVVLPAARPGVIAAWAIGFAFCLRDVGASMPVYPPGQDTFAVRIFTLMANGAPSMIAALCVMLVTVTLMCLAALGWLLRAALAQR